MSHQRLDPRDRVLYRRMLNLCLLSYDGTDQSLADHIDTLPAVQARVLLAVMTVNVTGLLADLAEQDGLDPREHILTLAGFYDKGHRHLHVVPEPIPCTTEEELMDTLARSIEQARPPDGAA